MMFPAGHTHFGPEEKPPESPQYVTSETGSGAGGEFGASGAGGEFGSDAAASLASSRPC